MLRSVHPRGVEGFEVGMAWEGAAHPKLSVKVLRLVTSLQLGLRLLGSRDCWSALCPTPCQHARPLGYLRVGAGGPVVEADCGALGNVWTWSVKA